MRKTLITLSIIATLAIAVLAVYLLIKQKKSGQTTTDTASGLTSDSRFPLAYDPHVKKDIVRSLQAKLNSKLETCIEPNYPKDANGAYIKTLEEDGYFGKDTLAVVKFFFNGKEQVTQLMYNSL